MYDANKGYIWNSSHNDLHLSFVRDLCEMHILSKCDISTLYIFYYS